MKKKLNFFIVFLIIANIIIGSLVIYKYLIFEKYTVSFKLNGATTIDRDSVICDFSLSGCTVILPAFQRVDGEVIGYGYNANDTKAHYLIGEKIKLSNNEILYAISSKKNVVTIAKEYDQIDNEDVSCIVYNEEKTCRVKLPRFNKVGYQNIGYSTGKDTLKNYDGNKLAYIEYLQNEEYYLSGNILLYPRYEAFKGKAHNVKYYGQIHGNYLEVGKDVSDENINLHKKYLDEIYQYAPYLFANVKINLLSEKEANKYWGSDYVKSVGLTYATSSSLARMPKDQTIDIKVDYYDNKNSKLAYEEKYHTLVHEMTHSWNSYYGIKRKGIKPTEISNSNDEITKKTEYYSDYHLSTISSQSDIKALYDKYLPQYKRFLSNIKKNKNIKYTGPLSAYAFSSLSEFVSEAFAYYYLKYIVPTGEHKNANVPDDIKKVIEKYICIAKNNYQQNGCV